MAWAQIKATYTRVGVSYGSSDYRLWCDCARQPLLEPSPSPEDALANPDICEILFIPELRE